MPFNMSSTSALPINSALQSQGRTAKSLSLFEKVGIVKNVITTFLGGFAYILRGLFRRASSKPPTFTLFIRNAFTLAIVSRMTPRQWADVNDSDDAVYLQRCKTWGITPKSLLLEDGTSANWIGNPDAKNLVVNFHGGGYVLSASWYMQECMFRIHNFLVKDGKDVALLLLNYDLAPDGQYPRQLQQATMLFQHLIHDLHRDPASIILMGDSAGGNLCMALMSHVLHPHPSPTIPPLTLPSPIRGMILVSPWIDLSVNRASVTTNKYKDYLWPVTAKLWASAWLGTPWPHTANTDRYNQAITAPQDWWNGLPADELLIVAGKDEVLIDGIVEFAETLKAVKGKDVQVVVAPGECHDFPAIEIYYEVKDTGLQTRVMRSWLAERM